VLEASVSASAVNAEGVGSLVATAGPTRTVVTTNFQIDLIKEFKAANVDTNGDNIPDVIYVSPTRTGDPSQGSREGSLMEYTLRAEYQQGSLLADSDETSFESSYVLYDYYTDRKLYSSRSRA